MQSSRVSTYLAASLTILIFLSGWHSAVSKASDVTGNIRRNFPTVAKNGAAIDPNNDGPSLSNNGAARPAIAIVNIRRTSDVGDDSNGTAKASCSPLSRLRSFGAKSFGSPSPRGALIQAIDGNFYGTTFLGGQLGRGMVFKITPAGVETVLYSFTGTNGDGSHPAAGLISASDGNFYGTTFYGGKWGGGTVFKITPEGVETVLLSFGDSLYYPPDGLLPTSLIQGRDGDFYGTTHGGGANNNGTVFKVTPAGVETVLHSFADAPGDGYDPDSLMQASDSNFYGTTTATAGSPHFGGTVFKITPAGAETVLHSFGTTRGDGTRPWASLTQAKNGVFYGTTLKGGANDEGTVFKITPAGVETVLHSFGDTKGDGREPAAGLIQAGGSFYGTTTAGGAAGHGTVFRITPAGVETVLYSFTGREGYYPAASLIRAMDGQLYGTTAVTAFSCTLK